MVIRRLWLVAALSLSGTVFLAAAPARSSGSEPAPIPTVDRLAAPPTVTNPTQADVGAQLFWQHCQPCHGDQAQGLTDDWRAQYPLDHQNCWKSGCHGDPPYKEHGFILPRTVPALIGSSTLTRFATAADLYGFVSQAMPFQAPGSLKPEEYWAITAFLLRGHGLPAAALPINSAGAAQRVPLGATATAPLATATPPPAARPSSQTVTIALVIAAGLALAGGIVWRRSQSRA